jgi:hypothetical protein
MFDAPKQDTARLGAPKPPPLGGREEAARQSRAGRWIERCAEWVKCAWAWLWDMSLPVFIAIGLTALTVYGYWFVASLSVCEPDAADCLSTWDRFWKASPNEMGDTLAGLSGGLVLIWVVASVFMQNRELRETRKEVAGQRIEMEQQRVATEAMARAMAAQADVFKDEQRQRLETRTDETLEELLFDLRETMTSLNSLTWYLEPEPDKSHKYRDQIHLADTSSFGVAYDNPFGENETAETALRRSVLEMFEAIEKILARIAGGEYLSKPEYPDPDGLVWAISLTTDICGLEFDMSHATRIRLARMNVSGLKYLLTNLKQNPEMWREKDFVEDPTP